MSIFWRKFWIVVVGLLCLASVLWFIIVVDYMMYVWRKSETIHPWDAISLIASLIIFAVLVFFILKMFKNKTFKYFFGLMSDAEYDAYVKSKIETQKPSKQVALSKFDLDESELNELPPVCLSGYYFDEKNQLAVKKGKDRKWRSSAYQVSWLFFSSEQVCVYQYTLNVDKNEELIMRVTKQYFWKEIVAFNTFEGTKKVITVDYNALNAITKKVNVKHFSLVVPGNELELHCAMPDDDSFDKTLRGMKATLKAKKEV